MFKKQIAEAAKNEKVDIWKFIKSYNVPYCELYDRGYTSLGSTIDTVPNPSLNTEHGYKPAYELQDGSKERDGRLSHN